MNKQIENKLRRVIRNEIKTLLGEGAFIDNKIASNGDYYNGDQGIPKFTKDYLSSSEISKLKKAIKSYFPPEPEFEEDRDLDYEDLEFDAMQEFDELFASMMIKAIAKIHKVKSSDVDWTVDGRQDLVDIFFSW